MDNREVKVRARRLAVNLSLVFGALGCTGKAPQIPMGDGAAEASGQAVARIAGAVEPLATGALSTGPDASKHVGLFVGAIAGGERWGRGYGRTSAEQTAPPDEQTIFEIGSITKVFTSVLLAQMAQAGEVALSGLAQKHFPAGIKAPEIDGASFTLEQLSTHSSGLPRLPANLLALVKDPSNPYAHYKRDDLFAFLGSHRLSRPPGARFEYSNLGAGLLGELLSLRAGIGYEELLRVRVLDPLGLSDTRITLDEQARTRLAPGHDGGQRVSGWDFDALAGAGALRSTGKEMLTFLAANLAARPELKATHEKHFQDPNGEQVGLGWMIAPVSGASVHWHNGGTGGYRSFIAFVLDRQIAVVVLANAVAPSVDALGLEMLKALLALPPAGGT